MKLNKMYTSEKTSFFMDMFLWIGRFNIVETFILLKAIYRFNAIYQNLSVIFIKKRKNNCTNLRKSQISMNS